MDYSDTRFYASIVALIKRGDHDEALGRVRERLFTDQHSPYLYSLAGTAQAARKEYESAVKGALIAYAYSRNLFYRDQLEGYLAKAYKYPPPVVLDSLDFRSFFKERRAKLAAIPYEEGVRELAAVAGQPPDMLPSALHEEMVADRGLWIAEDKNLDVIYAPHYHSLPVSDNAFLIERAGEYPPWGDFLEDVVINIGTIGVISSHIPSCTITYRKNSLPRHNVRNEAVYIGGSPNFGHFLIDFLPKLENWARAKAGRDLPVYTSNLSGFFREITQVLFPEFRFVDLASFASEPCLLCFEHVHVPCHVPAGFAFPLLRKRAHSYMQPQQGASERIYLSRGKAFQRLTNEDELTARLRKLGFTIIDTMEKSFTDIIAAVSNARLIVTGTGAQVSYIIFCRPGAELIELMPDSYVDDEGWRVNDRVYLYSRARHRMLICATESTYKVGPRSEWCYACKVDAVEQAVRESAARLGYNLAA